MESLTLEQLRVLEQRCAAGVQYRNEPGFMHLATDEYKQALLAIRELIALLCSKITIRGDLTPEELAELRRSLEEHPGEIVSVPNPHFEENLTLREERYSALWERYERLRKAAETGADLLDVEPTIDSDALWALCQQVVRELRAVLEEGRA